VRILVYSHCFYLLFLFLPVLLFLLLPYLFLFCSFLCLLVLHTVLFAAVAAAVAIDVALLLPSLVAVAIVVARLADAASLSCFEADHVLVVVSAMLRNAAAVVHVGHVVLPSIVGLWAMASVAVLPSFVWAKRPLSRCLGQKTLVSGLGQKTPVGFGAKPSSDLGQRPLQGLLVPQLCPVETYTKPTRDYTGL